jgi:bacillithiol system protein YtxJ
MQWIPLTQIEQIEDIIISSQSHPVLIFKHSTRCSISSSALSRIERQANNLTSTINKTYFVDLLQYRPVSNALASTFEVEHQSPQVLIISNGKCIYNASHMDIQISAINEEIKTQIIQ